MTNPTLRVIETDSGQSDLFDPHLPLEERVARLEGVVMLLSALVQGQQQTLIALGQRDRSAPVGDRQARIELLDLSPRVHNILVRKRMVHIDDLISAEDLELLRLPNFGAEALREVRAAVDAYRERFRVTNDPPEGRL